MVTISSVVHDIFVFLVLFILLSCCERCSVAALIQPVLTSPSVPVWQTSHLLWSPSKVQSFKSMMMNCLKRKSRSGGGKSTTGQSFQAMSHLRRMQPSRYQKISPTKPRQFSKQSSSFCYRPSNSCASLTPSYLLHSRRHLSLNCH